MFPKIGNSQRIANLKLEPIVTEPVVLMGHRYSPVARGLHGHRPPSIAPQKGVAVRGHLPGVRHILQPNANPAGHPRRAGRKPGR
jgi:hypothetical protein